MLNTILKKIWSIYCFTGIRNIFNSIMRFLSNILKNILYYHYYVFGFGPNSYKRVHISKKSSINNALLNVNSGHIYIEDYVFFGHNSSILTGTHDYNKFNIERMTFKVDGGHDIIIKKGAWLGSNVTVLGPCEIGQHSVIASGAVVINNVPDYEIWGGIPAKKIKNIEISIK